MNAKTNVREMMYVGLFAALTAIMGMVSIPLPISPVPISGQTLAIMLTGSILTPRQAGFSILTFLLVGAVGIPVFAGGAGGFGVIVGPRGGYLIGFLVGAITISLLKGSRNSLWRLAVANSIGGIVMVYLFGAPWLSFITGMSLEKAFLTGALPFIPGDMFKVALATFVGVGVNRHLAQANVLRTS